MALFYIQWTSLYKYRLYQHNQGPQVFLLSLVSLTTSKKSSSVNKLRISVLNIFFSTMSDFVLSDALNVLTQTADMTKAFLKQFIWGSFLILSKNKNMQSLFVLGVSFWVTAQQQHFCLYPSCGHSPIHILVWWCWKLPCDHDQPMRHTKSSVAAIPALGRLFGEPVWNLHCQSGMERLYFRLPSSCSPRHFITNSYLSSGQLLTLGYPSMHCGLPANLVRSRAHLL